jgi:leader peptidase (prepilin peptidase)/N-methyltransferase
VVLGCALDPSHEPARLLAGVAAALFLLLPALARPGAMGLGDVKLAGVLGLYLGPAVAPAILLALIAGVVAGGVIATRVGIRKARKTAVPFGPFLALGAVVAIFAGPALVAAYVRMV